MKPKAWMVVTWAGIIALLVGIAELEHAPNCEVPKSGVFHWLLKGHKFVPNHGRLACREVK